MNLGRGRPSVKVEGGGREDAGRVTGVVPSDPVVVKSESRMRLERPMKRAVSRAKRVGRMSGRRIGFRFDFDGI